MKFDISQHIGKRYGSRIVLGPFRLEKQGHYLLCVCDAGHEKWVRFSHLNTRNGGSCQICKNKRIALEASAKKKHKYHGTGIYKKWKNMINRVDNDRSYIKRGITCCEEWRLFDNFLKDMGEPKSIDMQIDRIDGFKSYYRENCRWSTPKENNANRTNLRLITYNGKTMCVAHWEKYLGLPREKLRKKLRSKKPIELIMKELDINI